MCHQHSLQPFGSGMLINIFEGYDFCENPDEPARKSKVSTFFPLISTYFRKKGVDDSTERCCGFNFNEPN